ncbi:hypothetical protein ACN23B_18045 [Anabaena sp. FACHB-709]|uniref:Uncharacterized protein n=2 Tax=Nostocaceae TaxID=1162 RepID=A0A1Z4KJR5_ANAVA|nr:MULTISPECIES: hypothetical protein [Nostocaceae]BAY69218.1 hypothetical protein NIES23_20110 [Trichormus variabilis NIES-23]MBD2174841.1 hypothetical protein [Anabaena cylindrica FACHB-318]MBD2266601.1 hypothetical protein [Anabaena sp. FACHB-709]MBD2276194.1 hypothetical protein [Nostoc sp. PCC 7120 = FACHB-418]MBD2286839.1 hypothetical protein [Anabaena cylindrica FACHB-170]
MSWHEIKHYKNYLFSCFGLSAAILLWSQTPTQAQFTSNLEPIEIYELSTPQTLTIPPIGYSEISLTTKSDSVSNQGDLLAPPNFNAFVIREFPAVWQMRVPIDQVDSLYATYEMKGENGRTNAVSNEQRSDSAVQVILEPLPIMEISRDLNSNTALVQGGLRLRMDISNAQFAGNYAGELTVLVERR